VDEGFVGWMTVEDAEGEEKDETTSASANGKERRKGKKGRVSLGMGAVSPIREERDVPLPQQPKEVQVKGMRTCRDCWAVVS
jgi:rabenosyn-5